MDYFEIKDRLSNSKFKYFMECSARGYAEHIGDFEREVGPALIAGSLVDELLFNEPSNVDTSILYKKDGTLKKSELYLETIVSDIQSDEEMQKYLTGDYQKQVLFDINGIPWKAKLDVIPDAFDDMVVDFKTAKSIKDWDYSKRFKARVPFYYARGYDIQGAVYNRAVGRERFVLAIAIKQVISGRYLIEIPKEMLDLAMTYVEQNQERVWSQMSGENLEYCKDPECKYCRKHRKTTVTVADVFTVRDEVDMPF